MVTARVTVATVHPKRISNGVYGKLKKNVGHENMKNFWLVSRTVTAVTFPDVPLIIYTVIVGQISRCQQIIQLP